MDYFLIAGELSGDVHGAHLIKGLKDQDPHVSIKGVGGPKMRAEGMDCLLPMEKLNVMGISDVLLALPRLYFAYRKILKTILKERPKTVIFIDFPDFNMYLAKALRKKGFKGKLVQYHCPSVWAWRRSRINDLVQTLDLLLCILPFEPAYFIKTSLRAVYIGNPIAETILSQKTPPPLPFVLPKKTTCIGIFPGSRKGELIRNLPVQLEAAEHLLKKHPDLCFGLSVAQELHIPLIMDILRRSSLVLNQNIFITPPQYTHSLMNSVQGAIATSGTVTLELGLYEVPTVVIYKITTLNYLIFKYIIRLNLPHYSLTNIICNTNVFPELIHDAATPQEIEKQLSFLLFNESQRVSCLRGCKELKALLKCENSVDNAIAAITT